MMLAAAAGAGQGWLPAGSVRVTRSPCGWLSAASAVPWWAAAIAVTMASPRPDPGRGGGAAAR